MSMKQKPSFFENSKIEKPLEVLTKLKRRHSISLQMCSHSQKIIRKYYKQLYVHILNLKSKFLKKQITKILPW